GITFVNPDLSPGAVPVFFRSPPSATDDHASDDPEFSRYSFFENAPYKIDVEVTGTVVWLVTQGADFQGLLNEVPETMAPGVTGPGGTLILVAKAGHDPASPNRALWFQSGLHVDPKVKLFLVTEGDVTLMHNLAPNDVQTADAVTIVAAGAVAIGGPRLPARY